ncbi:hypothetical protein Rs2_29419 [Raphanus sativus]|nr:hypothetical protein Rs2_29419 [Raphanus sativus]
MANRAGYVIGPSGLSMFVSSFRRENMNEAQRFSILEQIILEIPFFPSLELLFSVLTSATSRGAMYIRIRLVAKTSFFSTRLLSSVASTDTLKEVLRKSGPRLSVPSLLQQRVESGHPSRYRSSGSSPSAYSDQEPKNHTLEDLLLSTLGCKLSCRVRSATPVTCSGNPTATDKAVNPPRLCKKKFVSVTDLTKKER